MKQFKQAGDIKVGVIGYGGAFNMGKVHLDEMRRAGMTPTAVAEIDAARLKVAETDFPGIETYGSVAAMLKQSAVNLLAIITPHTTHAKLALQCLRAGRHVVCEKPFAVTTAECDAMIAAARRRGVMLSTYHNRHWDGCALEAVRQLVKEKAIGDVYRVEINWGQYGQPGDWWRTSKSISGGILYDWGVHLLEYSLQVLAGAQMTEVSGFAHTGFWASRTKWQKDTNEDDAAAIVRFKGGQVLMLRVSQLEANMRPGWIHFTGTRGAYSMSHGDWALHTVQNGVKTVRSGSSPKSEGWRFYQNVADHLTRGAKLTITAEWARRPIHIIDWAGQSAQRGTALKTKYA